MGVFDRSLRLATFSQPRSINRGEVLGLYTLRSRQSRRSWRSFSLAASTVCHCMLDGASGPPAQRGVMWSTTQPGHAPRDFPVAGQGCDRLNSSTAARERCWSAALATLQKSSPAASQAAASLGTTSPVAVVDARAVVGVAAVLVESASVAVGVPASKRQNDGDGGENLLHGALLVILRLTWCRMASRSSPLGPRLGAGCRREAGCTA